MANKAVFPNIRELYTALGGTKGINAFAAACQIWLETGGTTSDKAVNALNFAGIKATDDWKGETYTGPTQEQGKDGLYDTTGVFRKYPTFQAFCVDYAKKWNQKNYVDAGLQKNLGSYILCFMSLKNGGWATDDAYFKKLVDLSDRMGGQVFGTSWDKKRISAYDFALESKQLNADQTKVIQEYLKKVPEVPEEGIELPAPEEKPADDLLNVGPYKGIYIGIDPGHGGSDPGAVNKSDHSKVEKFVTLMVSKKLDSLLRRAGFKTFLTRAEDKFIAVNERPKALNAQNVEFSISIHANSVDNQMVTGFETFVYTKASKNSKRLATHVINEWGMEFPKVKLRYTASGQDKYKAANLALVRDTKMPAVLIELDFISNNEMALKLYDPKYQDTMAQAIFYGIVAYLQEQKNIGGETMGKTAVEVIKDKVLEQIVPEVGDVKEKWSIGDLFSGEKLGKIVDGLVCLVEGACNDILGDEDNGVESILGKDKQKAVVEIIDSMIVLPAPLEWLDNLVLPWAVDMAVKTYNSVDKEWGNTAKLVAKGLKAVIGAFTGND